MKHTPGPWTASWDQVGRKWCISQRDHVIVTIWPAIAVRKSGLDEANARLIAAAPKMYVFVKSIFDSWDCDTGANEAHADYCRKCEALALLAEIDGKATQPVREP